MNVPESLSRAFDGPDYETALEAFIRSKGWISPDPNEERLHSHRFLNRSVVPHILRLSQMFNRLTPDAPSGLGLDPYWKTGSNPENLRLAYFLYFMPANAFRVASVWAELNRLGFRWATSKFRGLELGSGPATGAQGIAIGEAFTPLEIPAGGNFALIEQDRKALEMGRQWLPEFAAFAAQRAAALIPEGPTAAQISQKIGWDVRPFHRKIDLTQPLLPERAPRFDLMVSSYFLNEFEASPEQWAQSLLRMWHDHLEQEGIVILIEPALKVQSRRLLQLRKALLAAQNPSFEPEFQILLPCLGHQSCGALDNPTNTEDWCHEDVSWWRPPYTRVIDQLASLDRKALPFSYLVIARSKRPRTELLPALRGAQSIHRLVSPAHDEGRDAQFYICGEDGKRRARIREGASGAGDVSEIGRGTILLDAQIVGDPASSRIQSIRKPIA